MQTFGGLIDVDELAGMLDRADLRIVDCRFSLAQPEQGREAYLAGHLPGAVYAHLDDDLSAPVSADSGRHPLPDADRFIDTLCEWGISNDTLVVVYDDGSGGIAARLWWLLRWLGHSAVAVLDGGFAAWQASGLPVSADAPEPEPGTFAGEPAAPMTISAAELEERLASKAGYLLVDARDGDRFKGRHEPIDQLAGHVAGAVNLPFTAAITPDGRWRSLEALRSLWMELAAVMDDGDWAVMCGSGVTACHLALSAELAGLPLPRLYPGSWSEWIRDPARPVVSPES